MHMESMNENLIARSICAVSIGVSAITTIGQHLPKEYVGRIIVFRMYWLEKLIEEKIQSDNITITRIVLFL